MYVQKVLLTNEECKNIISLAGEFKPYKYYKQPEYIYYLDKKQREYFLGKFEYFNLKSFPKYIKILKYTEGIGFNLHIDSQGEDGRLKSIVTQLSPSDSYEGGDLELIVNSQSVKISKEIGNSVIYPASTPHKVSTITSGVRYVMVFWVRKWNLKLSKSII